MRPHIACVLAGILAITACGVMRVTSKETPKPGEAAAQPDDWSASVKHISLNEDGSIYLSLGGEIRERYEYYNEPFFGLRGVREDDYLLHRLLLQRRSSGRRSYSNFL